MSLKRLMIAGAAVLAGIVPMATLVGAGSASAASMTESVKYPGAILGATAIEYGLQLPSATAIEYGLQFPVRIQIAHIPFPHITF